jgi:hypothetical protein
VRSEQQALAGQLVIFFASALAALTADMDLVGIILMQRTNGGDD